MGSYAPVDYASAVDEYLDRAALGTASRRVYRISLTGWAWLLVGKPVPRGPERRGARPPVVPLAVLDDPDVAGRLAGALADRAAMADARTVNRELSALRSAIGWWQEQGWIASDPTAGLRHRPPDERAAPLDDAQVSQLFQLPVGLREYAFWRVLYDSGAPAADVLALDTVHLDLERHRVRTRPGGYSSSGVAGPGAGIVWRSATSQALRWLLAGRMWGPVFVTERRAPARVRAADICPVTRQARLSYRRAAELFTTLTRPLDPAGHGWTLHQLSAADASRVR